VSNVANHGKTVRISSNNLSVSIIYYDNLHDFEFDKSFFARGMEYRGVKNINETKCEVYYGRHERFYICWFEKNGKLFHVLSWDENINVARIIITSLH